MALIECSECKSQVSDKAPSCPKCGAPIAALPNVGKKAIKRKTPAWQWVAAGAVAVVIGFSFVGGKKTNKPEMPIDVTYRRALTGPGLVVAVKNKSERHLALVATFQNPTLGQQKTFRIDVAPKMSTEIGHLEGWSAASGDKMDISHNDYRSWSGNIP